MKKLHLNSRSTARLRRLILRRENLRPLTDDQLERVGGGATNAPPTDKCESVLVLAGKPCELT